MLVHSEDIHLTGNTPSGMHAPNSTGRFIDPLWLLALIFILTIIGLTTYFLHDAHDRTLVEAQKDNSRLVELITQDVENEYGKIDFALKTVVSEFQKHQVDRQENLEFWLNALRKMNPSLNILRTTTSAGDVIYNPDDSPGLKVNIADRAYFQKLRDNPDAGLEISPPIAGRTTGKPVIVLARRLSDQDGRFLGIAFGSIPLETLYQRFSSLITEPGQVIGVHDKDGKLILRHFGGKGQYDAEKLDRPVEHLQTITSHPDRGSYRSRSAFDGADRVVSYLRSPPFNLYVSLGRPVAAILSAWRQQVFFAGALLAALLATLAVTFWQLKRSWRRKTQAMKQLAETEARFRSFFDHGPIGMAITSPGKGCEQVNAALCRILGYPTNVLMNKTWSELTHPDDLATDEAQFKRVLSGEIDNYSLEKRFIHGDGHIVDALIAVRALRHSDGTVAMISSSVQDISERKQVERQILASREMLRNFLDHFPGTAYVKDESLRVVLANTGFRTHLGIDPQQMIGRSNQELFPGSFGEKISADDRRIMANGGTTVIEEVFDGRYFESTKFRIDQHDHFFLGGITVDVTARHRAARRVEMLLELNAIGGTLPEKEFLDRGLQMAETITGSQIGFMHFVNEDQETIELITWTPGALKGCQAAYDPHYPISKAGIWADCFHERGPVVFNDYAGYTKKRGLPVGHAPLERLISVPVIEEGKVRMMMGVGNKPENYDDFDIQSVQLIGNDLWRVVRRARAEQELRLRLDDLSDLNQKLAQAQGQLLQSEKMSTIGQLAAGVAHELNNPIGFIQSNLGTLDGYVDDLLEIIEHADACMAEHSAAGQNTSFEAVKAEKDFTFLRDDIRQLLAESKDGANRVRRIVQNLKDFSHVSEEEWSWAELKSGLESTLNIVWNELKYKAEVEKQYAILPDIYCMPSQLNQVFMNLLVNAAQAIENKGKITIATGLVNPGNRPEEIGDVAASAGTPGPQQHVWIEISDTGKGIPEANLSRIFDPFFTTKPVGKGTGLGLSLAWSIVQKHHGTLTVKSTVGTGTTFRITLPMNGSLSQEDSKK